MSDLYDRPTLETGTTAPNFTPGDRCEAVYGVPRTIEEILIHWWDEPSANPTFDGTVNWLSRSTTQASAHRIVEDGRRARMVEAEDVAWHAGTEANPKSIAVEGNPRRSDGDYAAMGAEVASIRQEQDSDLPLRLHHEYMRTSCSQWDLDRIDREARAYQDAVWGSGSSGSSDSNSGSGGGSGSSGSSGSSAALDVDGRCGRLTISELQRLLGVTVDGRAGEQTWTALQQYLSAPFVDGIISRQSYRATELGNGIVPRAWDFTGRGSSGSQTVQALQRKVGVNADGIWFEATTRALQRALNNGNF